MISSRQFLVLVSCVLISCIILPQGLAASTDQQSSSTPEHLASENSVDEDGFPPEPDEMEEDEPFDLMNFLNTYFGKSERNNLTGSDALNQTENTSVIISPTDDEIFLRILGNESFTLNLLSLQCIIALDQNDQTNLRSTAERLHNLALDLQEQVEPLDVEDHHLGRKQVFLESMETFIEVTRTLKDGSPEFVAERRVAYASLTNAVELLDNAVRNINCMKVSEIPDTMALHSAQEVTWPDDIRQAGMPFVYYDSTRSNEISLSPQYARNIQKFYYEEKTGLETKTRHINAPEGSSYMQVYLIISHRGNLDGKKYTIQTPPLSAFTLYGPEGSYKPITTERFTSLGEMYTQKSLDRRESSQSSLLFEVPDTLTTDTVYLSVNLGSTDGTISWNFE